MKTKDLVLVAMYTALFAVVEYVSVTFGILEMPQGGSISLSSIVLMMASYHLGFKKSLLVSFLTFIIMFMIKPPLILTPIQFLMDYIFAYSAYALTGLFKDVKIGNLALPIGVVVSNVIRFMFHNIAGWVYFSEYYPNNPLIEVMVYNATYMLPTLIIGFIVIMAIKPRINSQF